MKKKKEKKSYFDCSIDFIFQWKCTFFCGKTRSRFSNIKNFQFKVRSKYSVGDVWDVNVNKTVPWSKRTDLKLPLNAILLWSEPFRQLFNLYTKCSESTEERAVIFFPVSSSHVEGVTFAPSLGNKRYLNKEKAAIKHVLRSLCGLDESFWLGAQDNHNWKKVLTLLSFSLS